MNNNQKIEFLNTFIDPANLLEDETESFAMRRLHSEILQAISSEDLYGESLKGVEYDIGSFISTCEEMDIDPMELIHEFLELMLANKKTIEFQGQTVSLEGLPDFFIKSKQNFLKENESEDINNF